MKKFFWLIITVLVVGMVSTAASYKYNNTTALYQRGQIKAVTFQIEYPNGQTKQVSLSNEQMRELGGVVFNDALIKPGDMEIWNVSNADWQLNPSMLLLYLGSEGGAPKSTPFCRWKWHVTNGEW